MVSRERIAMCGISGLVNGGDRETLARVTAVQVHRGPDDSGLWERRFPNGGYVGLGSRRLAILDLSPDGHMPMCNEGRTVWITYNGEIYNFAELRHDLESRGHRFVSRTDTEVVLHLYEEEGPECVKRLNGMFAFALCDLRSGTPELFFARDHFGVKPFYYAHAGERFAFASEMKALLEVPWVEAELDPESLHQYLTFLWVPEPRTMLRGIHKLAAGHYATFRDGRLTITKYWDLTFPNAEAIYPRSENDLADEIRERFGAAVKAQMVSDVPVGAFLSAGLDSSSIVAMMAGSARRPLRTYTITFPAKYRVGENTIDDPKIPAGFAQSLGCEHHEIVVEPDVASLLPHLVWHMDDPTADPAILAAYLVCREAGKRATVLLSGVGGDEVFAGYRKHCAYYWAQAYQNIPAILRRSVERRIANLSGFRGTSLKGISRLIKKMARSASLTTEESFLQNCTYLDDAQKAALYMEEWSAGTAGFDPYAQHRACFDHAHNYDFLNQMLYLDSKIFMPSLNLNYNDKMSMASSVEVRVPFLDREFAEFVAWNVPPDLKLKGRIVPTTKHIFRKAMQRILPREVLTQPKAGFAVPVDYWLANDLKEMVDDLLCESRIRERGLFASRAVRNYVMQHRQGMQDWSMQIWQLLTLELWMQTLLDRGTCTQMERSGPVYEVARA
jgi:asparagine synthase (glutamine-hydrolysing)